MSTGSSNDMQNALVEMADMVEQIECNSECDDPEHGRCRFFVQKGDFEGCLKLLIFDARNGVN